MCKVEPRLCENAPQFVQYRLKMVPSAPWERLRQAREAFWGPNTPQAGFWAGLPRESFTPNEAFLHVLFCVFFGTPQEMHLLSFGAWNPPKLVLFEVHLLCYPAYLKTAISETPHAVWACGEGPKQSYFHDFSRGCFHGGPLDMFLANSGDFEGPNLARNGVQKVGAKNGAPE